MSQKMMSRGDIVGLAERLADRWIRGRPGVLDVICDQNPAVAAALAVNVAVELDQVFNEGPAFRSALLDRAEA